MNKRSPRICRRRRHSAARFVVSAGHIHNYERLSQDGVTYLVPAAAARRLTKWTARPRILSRCGLPNYHYVRFELFGKTISCEMIRLQDYAARDRRTAHRRSFRDQLQP